MSHVPTVEQIPDYSALFQGNAIEPYNEPEVITEPLILHFQEEGTDRAFTVDFNEFLEVAGTMYIAEKFDNYNAFSIELRKAA